MLHIGNGNSVAVSMPPTGHSIVADIHSHGAYDPKYEDANDTFSFEDKQLSNARQWVGYLATPIGYLKRYNPFGYNGKIGEMMYTISWL